MNVTLRPHQSYDSSLGHALVPERRSWTSGLSTPANSTPASSGAPRRGKSMKISKAKAEAVTHDLTGEVLVQVMHFP